MPTGEYLDMSNRSKEDQYDSWSKQELIKEIKKLQKRKKYGLVWDAERTKEIFEKKILNKLPLLKEITRNSLGGGGYTKTNEHSNRRG